MLKTTRTKLLVFDLDGTLIDSRRDLADATNALIAEYGGPPLTTDQVTAMVGEGAALLVRRALAAAGLDPDTPGALDRFLVHYDLRLTAHTRPYNGIPEALAALRASGLTLALLTNKPRRATMRILEELKLAPMLSHVVGGDTAAGRKPDPAGLLQIVDAAGAVPAETILVGDSRIDMETARRGGTRVCLTRYGFGYRFNGQDFRGDELFVDEPGQLVNVAGS
jgi:phosphoglycolate phosphatase